MYVCVSNYSSQPLNPFAEKLYQQIERFTLIAIGYCDLKYLPNMMNFVPESAVRCTGVIFANGNVLRDVIVVISVTIRVFRNNPD